MFSVSVNCKSKLFVKLLNVNSQLQPETEIASKNNFFRKFVVEYQK